MKLIILLSENWQSSMDNIQHGGIKQIFVVPLQFNIYTEIDKWTLNVERTEQGAPKETFIDYMLKNYTVFLSYEVY